LGEDARMVILIHVTSDAEAAGIRADDRIQFVLFGRTTKAIVLRRRDSGANVQTDFWAMQLTPKDK